jgi:hypothetical protein
VLYFRFDLKFRRSVPNPFKCKREQILHTADPCSLHSRRRDSFSFVLNRPTPFRFVVVCLFLFDCMYLINVAILYKYQPCMPRTIYPVAFPSICPSAFSSRRSHSLSSSWLISPSLFSPCCRLYWHPRVVPIRLSKPIFGPLFYPFAPLTNEPPLGTVYLFIILRQIDDDYVLTPRRGFTGSGSRLGGVVPEPATQSQQPLGMPGAFPALGTPSSTAPAPAAALRTCDKPEAVTVRFSVDQSKPTTSVQIRLADGTR